MDVHSCEVNWAPLSDVMWTHRNSKMCDPVRYECLARWLHHQGVGAALSSRRISSTTMRRRVNPLDGGGVHRAGGACSPTKASEGRA